MQHYWIFILAAQTLSGAVRHLDVIVEAGGSLVETYNLAVVIDAPRLRGGVPANHRFLIGRG